jgi:preprotein translocase subunit SecG
MIVKMMRHKKLWTLLLLGLAVAAIIVLASGLSGLELLPGHPFSFGGGLPSMSGGSSFSQSPPIADFLRILMAFFILVLFPLSIIYLIISSEARKRLLRDAIAILSFIVLLYFISRALHQFGLQPQGNLPQAPAPPPATDLPAPADFVSHPPQWFVFTASLILIGLLLALLWFLWQRAGRRGRVAPLQALAQEAEEALADLRAGGNLKDTIMRCYAEMSRVLRERRGIRRKKAMTPREFEQHLQAAGLSDEHVQRLTRLFEAVRYGGKKTGEREEREAQACLEAIVVAYEGPS